MSGAATTTVACASVRECRPKQPFCSGPASPIGGMNARLPQYSRTTPEPTVRDQTANTSDDSPADGIQGHHADQHECEHHQGCAALPVAVGPCVHKPGNADEKCSGEENSAGPGEPKPMPEPTPVASNSRHALRVRRNGR